MEFLFNWVNAAREYLGVEPMESWEKVLFMIGCTAFTGLILNWTYSGIKDGATWVKSRWTGEYLGVGRLAQSIIDKLTGSLHDWKITHYEPLKKECSRLFLVHQYVDLAIHVEGGYYSIICVDGKRIESNLFNQYELTLIEKTAKILYALLKEENSENEKRRLVNILENDIPF